jgi:hypothetical protein
MNKLIAILSFVALFLSGLNVVQARPDEYEGDKINYAPSIFITQVKFSEEVSYDSKTLNGVLTVQSNEQNQLNGYRMGFELYKNTAENAVLMDSVYDSNLLSIIPAKSQNYSFGYSLPTNLPYGNYSLNVYVYNPELAAVAWQEIDLGELGYESVQFVEASQYTLKKNEGGIVDPTDGVVIEAEKSLKLVVDGKVLRGAASSMEVYPHFVVYDRALGGDVVYDKTLEQSVQISKNKSGEISLDIPYIGVPGGYFAEVYFKNSNGEKVSEVYRVHWVESGESGRVVSATLNQTSFSKGDTASVDVLLADRADLAFSQNVAQDSLGKVDVNVYLVCGGKVVTSGSQQVDLMQTNQTIVTMPVYKNVNNCSVRVDLLNEGKTLHSKEFVNTMSNGKRNISDYGVWLYITFVTSLVALLGGVILILYKKRYGKKLHNILGSFLLVAAVMLSGVSYVLAGPCTAITLKVNSPIPEPYTYQYGETIPLDGSAHITYCVNRPVTLKLKFYVDDATTPFYEHDYRAKNYSSNKTTYFNSVLPGPLSVGEHKLVVDWVQDCTQQGEGIAKGKMIRFFTVVGDDTTGDDTTGDDTAGDDTAGDGTGDDAAVLLNGDIRVFPSTIYAEDQVLAEVVGLTGGNPPHEFEYELVSVGTDKARTMTGSINDILGKRTTDPKFRFLYTKEAQAPKKYTIEVKVHEILLRNGVRQDGQTITLKKSVTFFGEKDVNEVKP